MNNVILETVNLTVSYDGEVNAVNNLNFCVSRKEIVGIVGESGSGKTTLAKSLVNLLPARTELISGDIIFSGEKISSYNKKQWQSIRGNKIGMIFQNPSSFLNPVMKVKDQFVETIRSHKKITKAEAEKKALDTLEKLNFSNVQRIMKVYPHQLSGGMKQRVAIALAMTLEPELIIADEPTSALDVVTQKMIIRELMRLRDEFDITVIMVTHNLGAAAYAADRIMVMLDGNIVEFAGKESILRNPKDDYTVKLLQSIPILGGKELELACIT